MRKVMMVAALVAVAACGEKKADEVVDSAPAVMAPNMDSMHLADSLRIVDSMRVADSIRMADSMSMKP